MVLLISSILTFVDFQLLDCGLWEIFGHKGFKIWLRLLFIRIVLLVLLDLDLLEKWNDQHAQYVIWHYYHLCFKRGSMFSIRIVEKKLIFFFIQDLFYYMIKYFVYDPITMISSWLSLKAMRPLGHLFPYLMWRFLLRYSNIFM